MKRMELSLLIALIFSAVLSMSALNLECEEIRGSVLRLHVLANSDSEDDQNLKLKVRDRLLEVSTDIYAYAQSKDEAIQSTQENLSLLQAEAEKVIQENGYNYPVSVALEETYFNTRSYGDITLPAGNYQALRVIIGEGEGHNWWCVMFPPLCISAVSPEISEAENAVNEARLDDVLNEQQLDLVEGSQYEARFKCVELYEEFMQKIKN